MSATATKLSRAQACAEIAKRMGLFYQVDGENVFTKLDTRADADNVLRLPIWNPFTDRNASAELVAYMERQRHDGRAAIWNSFCRAFFGESFSMRPSDIAAYSLLATPEQIALAACAALGLSVE